eukprot:Gb_26531 [translate_table: standard]
MCSSADTMQATFCLSISQAFLHGISKTNARNLGSKNASRAEIFECQYSPRSDIYIELHDSRHTFSVTYSRLKIDRVSAGSINKGASLSVGLGEGLTDSEDIDGTVNKVPPDIDSSAKDDFTTNEVSLRKPLFENTQQVENDDTDGSIEETISERPGSDTSDKFNGSEFVKRDPELVPSETPAKPYAALLINLDLALYRAKTLARKGKYDDAEQILRQCIREWPDDGRPYMTLGRLLSKQAKGVEARSVFEKGCQATQGENAYIWQGWAVLERKMGNITKARKLFDAATAADKKHVAAWHGWAFLEISQRNVNKARDLLRKGLEYCGPNEYIFQTLALLEVKAKRYKEARSLFVQATKCNPKSCASWLAWAQLEAEQDNNITARHLFERAVQASPKNRFAWQIWALFEAEQGHNDKARKLFRVGHALNPKDPVLLQSLALLEYKCLSANVARKLFKQASQVDPSHQPVWIAWGWMEWKEGNLTTARELYQRAVRIDSRSTDAARCLQAWAILEERVGNVATARRLFRSSLNIDSQNYVTWMSLATLEENQGNSVRAEEIRNLYFQQRTEVVGDASWDVNLSDFFAPAINRIKGLLNFDQGHSSLGNGDPQKGSIQQCIGDNIPEIEALSNLTNEFSIKNENFDLDSFLREKLSLNLSNVYAGIEPFFLKKSKDSNRVWKRMKREVET